MNEINAGGPTGSTGPTNMSGQTDDAHTDPILAYPCRMPECKKSYATSRGRGVHEQRQHKNWHDEQHAANIVNKKAPWSAEEAALLARQEARLTIAGERFLNQALVPFFPNRTLEGIKGQRRYQQHKDRVHETIRMLKQADIPQIPPRMDTEHQSDEEGACLVDEIRKTTAGMERLEGAGFHVEHLNQICSHAQDWNVNVLIQEISSYIREIFPEPLEARRRTGKTTLKRTLTNRQKRRAEYGRVQRAWRRNPCGCLRTILKDKEAAEPPDKSVMIPYWRAIMTGECTSTPGVGVGAAVLCSLWRPIGTDEIEKALPEMTTAHGPDMVTARQLRAVPLAILARIFNIFMICGKIPQWLLSSRTVLIPKKDNATEPGEYRPITVSSVITRTYHKVLASRILSAVDLDQRQKAFVPVDGCAENTFRFDMLLRHHRQTFKPLYLASVDIAKAFDSVTHQTIIDTLKTKGIPGSMVSYIEYVYQNSSTSLVCGDWTSDKIHPTCGVKQGDPLSPILFNLVMDGLLRRIPPEVGVDVAGKHYNVFAFADDIIFVASTPQGLQLLLDIAADYLAQCGLNINASKSFTVAIRNVPHQKRSVVDCNTQFQCSGRTLLALRRQDEWKYLGVPFTPEGRTTCKPEKQLLEAIDKLTKAPLKPQQRVFALRVVVLPSLYHILTLGATNLSRLKKVDTLVRGAVRKWLALPHDVVNAYFHANVKDGGLSIPSMRWLMPLHRKERLEAMVKGTLDPTSFIAQEIARAKRRLREGHEQLDHRDKITKRWANLLHSSCDGMALKRSREVPQQHRWIVDGTRFLSGKDYLNSVKLRINALPTKSRCSRGRIDNRLCRAGCNEAETLNHIMQKCHRTHGARIARHNAIASYVKRALSKKYDIIQEEPHIQTSVGLRKPDLVAAKDNTVLVVDAQIVGEQSDLTAAHERKKEYYRDSIHSALLQKYNVSEIEYTSITLSCRGIWSPESAEDLVQRGILKKSELKLMASRALIGGINAYRMFSRTTATRRRIVRTGVG